MLVVSSLYWSGVRSLVTHLVTVTNKSQLSLQSVHSSISQYLNTNLPGGLLSRDVRQAMLSFVFKIQTDQRIPGK